MSVAHVVSVRANSTLKRYFEIELVNFDVSGSFPNLVQLGITKDNPPSAEQSGGDNGVVVDYDGVTTVHGAAGTDYLGASFVEGDILQCVVNFRDEGPNGVNLWFGKNGTFPNGNTIPAGDVTGGEGFESGTYYVHASCGESSGFTSIFGVRLKTKAEQFTYALPSGCVAWED